MIRLIYIAILLESCLADPKSPRIYNVLISSKKNLAPSHAQPVYEPVLRTTSIGYALPTVFYHSSLIQNVPVTYINPDYSGFTKIESSLVNQKEEGTQNSKLPLYTPQMQHSKDPNTEGISEPPLVPDIAKDSQRNGGPPVEHFIPHYDPYALNFANYLPNGQEGTPAEYGRTSNVLQQETDPKKLVANLKKNPGIPDVPPPPLPVKISQ